MTRPIYEIASEIYKDWKTPYYAATPYLRAMREIDSIDEDYINDRASSIVAYFLSNASTWRGDTAKRIKKELNDMLNVFHKK